MRALGLGLCLALLGLGHHSPTPVTCALASLSGTEPDEPLRWWVADRAGGRIVGLDEGLFAQWVVAVPCPVGVVRAGDGLWIVSVPGGGRHAGSVWTRLDASSGLGVPRRLGEYAGLVGLSDGGVLGLVGPAPTREWIHLDRGGEGLRREAFPGATYLAQVGGQVLVANRVGEVWSFGLEQDMADARHVQLGGTPRGVAPGPEGGWWWLGSDGELLLLRADLSVRWKRWVGERAACLAGDDKRVWVVPDDRSDAACWDVNGRRGGSFTMPLMGSKTACLTQRGGVLIALPGALLELGPDGRLLLAQAGFDHLVSISEPGP
ncbi:MAG: hypothetical protein CMJ98_01130 [Planctomycetes bacterium]|nr:hypothetical protein [Planctomycetota bacterium]